MRSSKLVNKLDYFLDVVMRNYCRTAEENDILYEEMADLNECLMRLYQENADLRFKLKEAGIEVPPSDFVTAEQLADLECLEVVK